VRIAFVSDVAPGVRELFVWSVHALPFSESKNGTPSIPCPLISLVEMESIALQLIGMQFPTGMLIPLALPIGTPSGLQLPNSWTMWKVA